MILRNKTWMLALLMAATTPQMVYSSGKLEPQEADTLIQGAPAQKFDHHMMIDLDKLQKDISEALEQALPATEAALLEKLQQSAHWLFELVDAAKNKTIPAHLPLTPQGLLDPTALAGKDFAEIQKLMQESQRFLNRPQDIEAMKNAVEVYQEQIDCALKECAFDRWVNGGFKEFIQMLKEPIQTISFVQNDWSNQPNLQTVDVIPALYLLKIDAGELVMCEQEEALGAFDQEIFGKGFVAGHGIFESWMTTRGILENMITNEGVRGEFENFFERLPMALPLILYKIYTIEQDFKRPAQGLKNGNAMANFTAFTAQKREIQEQVVNAKAQINLIDKAQKKLDDLYELIRRAGKIS